MHHDAVPSIDMLAILVLIALIVASCLRTWRTSRSPRTSSLLMHRSPGASTFRPPQATSNAAGNRRSALPPLQLPDLPPERSGHLEPAANRPGASPRPAATGVAATSGSRRRPNRERPPWYHRKFVVGPVVVLALFTMVLSAGAWYAASQLATLDDISTPPPEISGEFLDGDSDTVIDTKAAQEHVAEQEQSVETPPSTPVPPGTLTVLMMGVDAQPGQPIDIQVRADSLSVVHINPELGTCRMLSIPRDTRVELPGYGYSKINHALAIGGIPYQQLVVEQYLGISIDHYGLVDFSGLAQLVDAVGGVTVENNGEAFSIGGFDYAAGILHLSGDEAVYYARFRGGPDGDYGRQQRQQQVVRALLANGADLNLITAIPDILSTVRGHIRTDISARALRDLAQEHRETCTAESLETASIAGEVAYDWDDLSEQELMFVHIEEEEVETRLSWLLGNTESSASTDGDPVNRKDVYRVATMRLDSTRTGARRKHAASFRHREPHGVARTWPHIGHRFPDRRGLDGWTGHVGGG